LAASAASTHQRLIAYLEEAAPLTPEGSRYAEEIRAMTRDRVDLIGRAGDRWRFAASLKSVIEDVAQEYAGRAVLELIQNGHDAIERGSSRRTCPPGPVRPAGGDLRRQ
jgi:hypothetical protein